MHWHQILGVCCLLWQAASVQILSKLKCKTDMPVEMQKDVIIVKSNTKINKLIVSANGTTDEAPFKWNNTRFFLYRNAHTQVFVAAGVGEILFMLPTGEFRGGLMLWNLPPRADQPLHLLGDWLFAGRDHSLHLASMEAQLAQLRDRGRLTQVGTRRIVDCRRRADCEHMFAAAEARTQPAPAAAAGFGSCFKNNFTGCLWQPAQAQVSVYDREVVFADDQVIVFIRRETEFFQLMRLRLLHKATGVCYNVPRPDPFQLRIPTGVLPGASPTPSSVAVEVQDPNALLLLVAVCAAVAILASVLVGVVCVLLERRRRANRRKQVKIRGRAQLKQVESGTDLIVTKSVLNQLLKEVSPADEPADGPTGPIEKRNVKGRRFVDGRWSFDSPADELVFLFEQRVNEAMMNGVESLATAIEPARAQAAFRDAFKPAEHKKGFLRVVGKHFPFVEPSHYNPAHLTKLNSCVTLPCVTITTEGGKGCTLYLISRLTLNGSWSMGASAVLVIKPTAFLDWNGDLHLRSAVERLIDGSKVNLSIQSDRFEIRRRTKEEETEPTTLSVVDSKASSPWKERELDDTDKSESRNKRRSSKLNQKKSSKRTKLNLKSVNKKSKDALQIHGDEFDDNSDRNPPIKPPAWVTSNAQVAQSEVKTDPTMSDREPGGAEPATPQKHKYPCPKCDDEHPAQLAIEVERLDVPVMRVGEKECLFRATLVLVKQVIALGPTDRLIVVGNQNASAGFAVYVLLKLLTNDPLKPLDEEAQNFALQFPQLMLYSMYQPAADIVNASLAACKEAYKNKMGKPYQFVSKHRAPTMEQLIAGGGLKDKDGNDDVRSCRTDDMKIGAKDGGKSAATPTPDGKAASKSAAKDAPKAGAKEPSKPVAKDGPKVESKDAPKEPAKKAPDGKNAPKPDEKNAPKTAGTIAPKSDAKLVHKPDPKIAPKPDASNPSKTNANNPKPQEKNAPKEIPKNESAKPKK